MGICVKREWLGEAPGASAEVKPSPELQQRPAVRSGGPDQLREGGASAGDKDWEPALETDSMPFTLRSPAFANGQTIPPRHTADGDNISPPLEWSDAPAGTRSYALIVEDPDAPGETGETFLHWAVYNIAAERDRLPESTTQGAKTESLGHGINDYGHAHYDGPNPPRGHAEHHYRFRLMALDVEVLGLGPKATVGEVRKEANKHLLGEAELVGTYAHPERRKP